MRSIAATRRSFVKGAGTVTLGLPFLEAIAGDARGATRPLRFIVFMHRQGTIPERWKPKTVGANFETTYMLEPLAPWKGKLNVWSGINNELILQWPQVTKQIFDSHACSAVSLLTGQRFKADDPLAGVQAPADGPSIDYVIAKRMQMAPDRTPIPNLNLGGSSYQFSAAGVKVGSYDPLRAWKVLTGAPTTAAPAGLAKVRTPVLDAVKTQLGRLVSSGLGKDDKNRLGSYLARVEEMEKELAAAAPAGARPTGCVDAEQPAPGLRGHAAYMAHIRNAVMALSCDLTRVVCIDVATDPDWAHLETDFKNNDWHNKVHEHGRPDLVEAMAVGFRWYGTLFASLLQQLDAVDEGGSTLLDNCLCLWLSEFGDGGLHDASQLPVVVAGGLGGRLRTGRHLAFNGRAHHDLLTTILNLFGYDDKTFGFDGPGFNRGPLPIS